MDPIVRWSMVAAIFLPAAILVARVNLRLITHHPMIWARSLAWRGLGARSGLLWGDGHVALGDPILSNRIWQARFVGLLSIVAATTWLAATNPRCVTPWL